MSVLEIITIIASIIMVCFGVINYISIAKLKKLSRFAEISELKQILNDYNISNQSLFKDNFENVLVRIKDINSLQIDKIALYNQNIETKINSINLMQQRQLEEISKILDRLVATNELKLEKMTNTIAISLEKIMQNNENRLEQIRVTVDEKLNSTLQKRLDDSFAIISNRLEAVTLGLGEMKTLASGVGDLKRVLTNVKTRGTLGEVQLEMLLEQFLANGQFERNVMIKENSLERVDFAIKMPGKDDKNILLPIDSKFPIEDYIKLQNAYDNLDAKEIEDSKKALEKRVATEAKKIKEKYIDVPTTTDFAIMYLAVEGLYSEILRNSVLVESLQREHKIILCGPNTLSALLNSLQMGFKTMAIQKRSSEIWNMLSLFKKEFGTFVELISKTQKKISEASTSLEDATKKTAKIQKQLNNVAIFTPEESSDLLDAIDKQEDDDK